MESYQYRGYQIEARREWVELVRQRLSHTPRIANLAATNFARFDDAKG
jgi:hypothetical protein